MYQLSGAGLEADSKGICNPSDAIHECYQYYVVVENGGPGIIEEVKHG
jgi:hypothetical protein